MRKSFAVLCFALATALFPGYSAVADESSTSRYIVRFESEGLKIKNPDHETFVSHLQQNLRKNMAGLPGIVKSPMKANVTPLWIANSFAIDATEAQIEKIARLPNVAEVVRSEYRIYLDKDINKKAVKADPAVIQW
ncbi:MAG: protease inhibitor I9 family protein, partial [Candidatus Riflebacteria bacterium]|nr:protease inhibitor I9 family protein [Candidatus Riflebacteria bacterium]